jgi:hypothetical protein
MKVVIGPCILLLALLFSPVVSAESIFQRQILSAGGEGETLFAAALQVGVPETALREAFEYFDTNLEKIENRRYLSIIDYSRPNAEKRMFIIDLESGDVEKRLVSHGAGRDDRQNPRDRPRYFSNEPNSREGSLGFFITGTEYPSPKFERALNLHGQEERNSNAYERRIVFHGADYVQEEAGQVGRSWGCPAVDNLHAFRLIDQLKDGSLFYITVTEPMEVE